jgi:8-oxo-dGTP pyrophosphatase MutT (NUDIX family)
VKTAVHSVRVALFSRSGEVLLLRRSYTDPWKPLHWNLPGGKVDPGEDPAHTAGRELHEEAGISVPLNFLQCRFDVAWAGRVVRVFAASVSLPLTAKGSDGEHDLFVWAYPSQLPEPLIPGTREILASLSTPL